LKELWRGERREERVSGRGGGSEESSGGDVREEDMFGES
jgi:hypothetical protein